MILTITEKSKETKTIILLKIFAHHKETSEEDNEEEMYSNEEN